MTVSNSNKDLLVEGPVNIQIAPGQEQEMPLQQIELKNIGKISILDKKLESERAESLSKEIESAEQMEKRIAAEIQIELNDPTKRDIKAVYDAKLEKRNDSDPEKLPEQRMYAAFLSNLDAYNFKLNIQNYAELDHYRFKSELRAELFSILEPFTKQAAVDRSQFLNYERKNNRLEE